MAPTKDCVFCKIANGQERRTLYGDEQVIVFQDIQPAAERHYLICPRDHIPNAKSLTSQDIPLVEHMLHAGKLVLQQQNADLGKTRFGFHWPPFCSVNHLHLHAISPEDGIKLRFRLLGVFSPRMPWFKSVDWLIRHLRASNKLVKADDAVLTDADHGSIPSVVHTDTSGFSVPIAAHTDAHAFHQDCDIEQDFRTASITE